MVRAQGVKGVCKGGQGLDPAGPCSHTEESHFIPKEIEIIEQCERKTELGLGEIHSLKGHSA